MMRKLVVLLVAATVVACSSQPASTPVTAETESTGDPQNGYPNPWERALFMAANRTRSDPSVVKGAQSTVYAATTPLMTAYDLERSSRFHATMLAKGHAPLMHESPCTLTSDAATSGCDGTPACGCVGGATCNSCGSCAAGTDPFARIAMFYPGGHGAEGEIIAAGYGDPWATMDAWVDEPAGADGHRQIVTSGNYGVAGFGHAADASGCYRTFDGGDFAGDKPAIARIPSAAPKPIAGAAGSFRIYATWADPAHGAPADLRAVVDGACYDMTRELGDATRNSTWRTDVTLGNGCHSVWILGHGAAGERAVYPGTTAFTVNVGNAAGCADSLPPPAAACDGAARDGGTASDGGTLPDGGAPADLGPDLASGTTPMAPSVTLESPSDGATYAPGAVVTIRAAATPAAGHTISGVVANWSRNGSVTRYPLGSAGGGEWSLALTLARSTGARSISVTATDDAGHTATSPAVTISVN